jgi:hypothetical protein
MTCLIAATKLYRPAAEAGRTVALAAPASIGNHPWGNGGIRSCFFARGVFEARLRVI